MRAVASGPPMSCALLLHEPRIASFTRPRPHFPAVLRWAAPNYSLQMRFCVLAQDMTTCFPSARSEIVSRSCTVRCPATLEECHSSSRLRITSVAGSVAVRFLRLAERWLLLLESFEACLHLAECSVPLSADLCRSIWTQSGGLLAPDSSSSHAIQQCGSTAASTTCNCCVCDTSTLQRPCGRSKDMGA